jgi:hypothetical protein
MSTKTADSTSSPWMRWQRSILDESVANARRLAMLPTLYQRAQRVKKGATPSSVVYEEDRLKLLHYDTDTAPTHRTPLVVVFALVNRPYILDLKPGRSVVSHFVKRGFDTYLIDWGSPSYADRQSAGEPPRLLHGRHHEHHVHRAAPGAGQEPDPDGCRNRFLDARGTAQPLDPAGVL